MVFAHTSWLCGWMQPGSIIRLPQALEKLGRSSSRREREGGALGWVDSWGCRSRWNVQSLVLIIITNPPFLDSCKFYQLVSSQHENSYSVQFHLPLVKSHRSQWPGGWQDHHPRLRAGQSLPSAIGRSAAWWSGPRLCAAGVADFVGQSCLGRRDDLTGTSFWPSFSPPARWGSMSLDFNKGVPHSSTSSLPPLPHSLHPPFVLALALSASLSSGVNGLGFGTSWRGPRQSGRAWTRAETRK